MPNNEIEIMDKMIAELEKVKTKFLTRNLWSQNVDFGISMWAKKIGKQTIVTYKEMAIQIEKTLQNEPPIDDPKNIESPS